MGRSRRWPAISTLTTASRLRISSSPTGAFGQTVERLVRELEPDVVGLSIMTFQRGTARKIAALVRRLAPRGHDRRRRLRSEPGAGGLRGSRVGRGRHRPGRRRHHVPRAACARSNPGRRSRILPGLSYREGDTFRRTPPRPVSRLTGEEVRAAQPRCPRAQRVHLHRPPDRRRRDLARLHLRLQLLLDHRDARHATFTPGRSSACCADIADARARGARAIFIVDDNITLNVARFEALCRAIVDGRLSTTSTTSSRR